MSIINCPECEKEVSDKADICIHCGFKQINEKSGSSTKQVKVYQSSESQINIAIDAIFAAMYVYFIYTAFSSDLGFSAANVLALFLVVVVVYFTQKIIKGVLGSIARSFDQVFNKNGR